ncbi:NRPS [Arachnomyces sp. PD_36]|nr:NRPS [Arachnomyces sp. PD_36]
MGSIIDRGDRGVRFELQRCLREYEAIDDAWIFDVVEGSPQEGLAVALKPRSDRDAKESDDLIVQKAGQILQMAVENLSVAAIFPMDWQWLVIAKLPFSPAGGVDDNMLRRYLKETRHTNGNIHPVVPAGKNTLDVASAHGYWDKQLRDAKPPTFPRHNPGGRSRQRTSNDVRQYRSRIPFPNVARTAISRDGILRAAWALLLARYSDTDDVCFGAQVFDHKPAVSGLKRTTSPVTAATVPIRVHVDPSSTIKSFLESIQTQSIEMAPYEQFGIENISKVNNDAENACNFSSMLVIQPTDPARRVEDDIRPTLEDGTYENGILHEFVAGQFDYPLLLQCILLVDSVELCVWYDPRVIAETQVTALCNHLNRLVQQLLSQDDTLLGHVSPAGPWDVQQAISWNNRQAPEIVDSCLHLLIAEHIKDQPNAVAIDAWDGKLTYSELESAVNRLAHYLIKAGVVTEDLIHVCFEKSLWYYIAILAVNKAGAAWVPMDPSHPIERQQQVIGQTAAKLAVASPANTEICASLGLEVITLDAAFDKALKETTSANTSLPPNRFVTSRNAAFVLFTSGSTGTPKGLVMEHTSICTSQRAICERIKLTSNARMLHFASHVFDASVCESMFTLMVGGCVCVPSDHNRMNGLPEFIREKNVNWASLIPSFLQTLKPHQVPSLQALIVGGEALGRDLLETWAGKLRLINVWGPAECCPISSLHEWTSTKESTLTIGRPTGSFSWIVDPQDHSQLAPIGCVGEVIIHGPTILREYLSNSQKTKETVFSSLPEWMPRRTQIGWRRGYKSGDLAFYNPDGTMEFVGRKDTQIKIRGLRVELGEVEYNIKMSLGIEQVAVDVFKTQIGMSIVSYLCFGEDPNVSFQGNDDKGTDIFLHLTDMLRSQIETLIEHLNTKLPRYMVPSIFIPCRYLPSITSTKLDRKKLQQLTAMLSPDEIAMYSLVKSDKRKPETDMEKRLQEIWASVLNISIDSIGRDDSFLQIGGDSIHTIELVSLARQHGIGLTVGSILKDARLSHVAAGATVVDTSGPITVDPFSIVPADQIDDLLEQGRKQCGLPSTRDIEDAYPCTPLQEGLMSLSVSRPGSYVARFTLYPPNGLGISELLSALATTVEKCSILRTRIILVPGGSFQVVLKDDMKLQSTQKRQLSEFVKLAPPSVDYGKPLSQFSLAEDGDRDCVVWDLHHSLYDGFAFGQMVRILQNACGFPTEVVNPIPLSNYVKFVQSSDPTQVKNYWQSQLEGAHTTNFPPNSTDLSDVRSDGDFTHSFRIPERQATDITTSSLLRGAWALILSGYVDDSDVVLACTVSGRSAPVPNIQDIVGPTIATVPVRVQIKREDTIGGFLAKIQQQSNDMIPYEHTGLQNIKRLGEAAWEACQFKNQLLIQPGEIFHAEDTPELGYNFVKSLPDSEQFDAYPLVLQCVLGNQRTVEVNVLYDSRVVPTRQIHAICDQFEYVVLQLATKPTSRISEVELCSPRDVEQIMEWNAKNPPQLLSACVHDLIRDQAQLLADKVAIQAWDGNFTYADLDDLSSRFALHLAGLGVRSEMMVAMCLEKSRWAVIAMMGIMKAGGAFVPLEPAHPEARHRAMVEKVNAKMLIVSPETASLCSGLELTTVVLSDQFVLALPKLDDSALSLTSSSPSNAAYVAFTSGTTGAPKGIVVEQAAMCSSIMGHGRGYGLGPATRMYNFSPFTSDGTVSDIFATLVFGGTVCMPSDTQRLQDTAKSIRDLQANVTAFTPSFANTMGPDDVPSLDTLILSGEVMAKDQIAIWCDRVKLINAYGPSEVCVDCTTYIYKSKDDSPTNIGRAHSGTSWIVDRENHHRLAPIGCVGELLMQGPALAREYFGEEVKTKKVFLDSVEFLPGSGGDKYRRFYKTGDLVKYNPDGTMEYCGRRDTQVKLRGQRVELGEIEYGIKKALASIENVAVEMVHRESGDLLVAFLNFSQGQMGAVEDTTESHDVSLIPLNDSLRATLLNLLGDLRSSMPAYMVPTVFLPLQAMPFGESMKIDRKTLQALVGSMSADELTGYSLASKDATAPTTQMEFKLRDLWAEVLKIQSEKIGKNDNFLLIGGDSLSAIHLVSLARKHSIGLTVSSILKDARLSHMAANTSSIDGDGVQMEAIAPLSLLPTDQKHLFQVAREQCGLSSDQIIEDIYPCTPLQEGLMALSTTQPGSYTARNVYKLPKNVDLARFKEAWHQTVRHCVNLRTRIIYDDGYSAQVVIKDDIHWGDGTDFKFPNQSVQSGKMLYGSRLCHYNLSQGADGHTYFTWSMHHSIFDGWCGNLMRRQLQSFYDGIEAPELQPYSRFIKYITDLNRENCEDYWNKQLQGARRTDLPPRSLQQGARNVDAGHASKTFTKVIPLADAQALSVTKATILRAAWAIIISRYCDTYDVSFGTSISGRNAPVAGLDAMTGPVIATVPVRVRLDDKQPVDRYLQDIQTQSLDMVAYEQFGLQNISKLSPEAHEVCDFSNLLVIQSAKLLNSTPDSESIIGLMDESSEGYFNYPLVVQGWVYDNHIEFEATYNSHVMTATQIETLSHHFDCVIQQLRSHDEGALLGDISLSGPWDIQQAIAWNGEVPDLDVSDTCIHRLVSRQVEQRPDVIAIDAWDGQFTYAKLESAADRLAQYLIKDSGVALEDVVHVCFEKSVWFFIAILAINKAGGAWAPLDPEHPIEHQQGIVNQTRSRLAIASPANTKRCISLGLNVVTIDAAFDRSQQEVCKTSPPSNVEVSAWNAAYILFTSGSTGKPKGVVLEHGSVCTSQVAVSRRLGMNTETRMLQFSSYVFDAFVTEALATLFTGGCVLIPSDQVRMNRLTDFIREKNITWALLTPSLTRMIKPEDVPSLKVLLLGGEAPGRDNINTWFGKARLINCWGPVEICVMSAFHEWRSPDESPLTIGRPVGGSVWLVDPKKDTLQPAPVGCVGEIVIQGPTLLREYLSNPTRTAQSVLASPEWMPRFSESGWDRVYRTGDLACYNADGTFEFGGRADTQVKIRGLRIELGDIEYRIQAGLPNAQQVAVDVFTTEAGKNLVAYLCFNQDSKGPGQGVALDRQREAGGGEAEEIFMPIDDGIRSQLTNLVSELGAKLPRYMIPTMFIVCRYMPVITSTKLDRAKLRQLAAGLSHDKITEYSLVDSKKRPPETQMEKKIQNLFASALKVPAESIGRDDSFLQIGGNSISAIQLVVLARQHGISQLTVGTIFRDSRLSHLAAVVESSLNGGSS